jgi:hypothetical protein
MDDPIVSYWAGFCWGDASLGKRSPSSYRLSFRIHSKDKNHLERFAKDIKLENPHIPYSTRWKPNDQVSLSLYSSKLGPQLLSWGIVPAKTYNWVEPQIPKPLIGSFLRGVVDADGSISKDHRLITITAHSTNLFGWIISHTPSIAYNIRDKCYENSTAWDLHVKGKDVRTFLEFIDWENPLRLERKYEHIDPTFRFWRKDAKGNQIKETE